MRRKYKISATLAGVVMVLSIGLINAPAATASGCGAIKNNGSYGILVAEDYVNSQRVGAKYTVQPGQTIGGCNRDIDAFWVVAYTRYFVSTWMGGRYLWVSQGYWHKVDDWGATVKKARNGSYGF